jgi:hypothetical protein
MKTPEKEVTEFDAKIAERVAELKKTHKEVFVVVVEVSEEDKAVCYLKKPNRQVISACLSIGANDPVKSDEILLAGCWIEGDERFKTEDDLFFAITPQLPKIVSFKVAELKKF